MKAAKAISRHKPIVALYVGGSEAGKRAGLSHTGSLSGPDEIYDGMFRQCGIIRAQTLTELFDYCLALGTLPQTQWQQNHHPDTLRRSPERPQPIPAGGQASPCPHCHRKQWKKLKPLIPRTASTANPVDMTFSKSPMNDFSRYSGSVVTGAECRHASRLFLITGHFHRPGTEKYGRPTRNDTRGKG